MKFLDRLFGKYREPNAKEESVCASEDEHVEIENNIPDIIGELTMGESTYLIREFEMDFMQDVDKNNHPCGITYGGFINLVFLDKPDYMMMEWIISPQKQYDGEIRFYKNTSQNMENSLMNILFRKASCVNYKVEFNASQNRATTLCICPRLIKIGHEEFE